MAGFQCRYANQFPWPHEQVQVAYQPCANCIAHGYNNSNDIGYGQHSETSMSISGGHMAEGPGLSMGTALNIGPSPCHIAAPVEAGLILGSAQEIPTTASVD
ncbi:ccch finger dna binding protein [Physcia stellaris]|nr:ccch finger dna binding protein [Physcia stellaris]